MGLYKFEIGKKLRERTIELENERNKSEKLLRDILPSEIVDEFKKNGNISPRLFKDATIIFTDFENFTSLAASMTPGALVTEINEIFMNFDMIIDKYELEKLKTIGDSYMIVAGIPRERADHADRGINAAFEMLEYLAHRNKYTRNQWNMRVGIHSGEVIAGVVGKLKYTYDIWGKSVSVAKQLERNGIPGKIKISQSVKDLLIDDYLFDENSMISIDSNQIKTYFISKSIQHS